MVMLVELELHVRVGFARGDGAVELGEKRWHWANGIGLQRMDDCWR